MEALTKVRSNASNPDVVCLLDYLCIKSYSPGMDFLRGTLAIWVMLAHLSAWGGIANQQVWGWLLSGMKMLSSIFQPMGETHPAVVGFIVLSGYCIHRNGARRERFNVWAYAIRRAFRIIPTYFFATILGAVVFTYFAAIDLHAAQIITGTPQIRWDGIAVKLLGISAFIPNLHFLGFQGNAPLTTVMVEIWLYVFYAIAMRYLILGVREETLWKVILALWVGGLAIVYTYPKYYSWWNNGSLVAFLPYWWIGAVAVNKRKIRFFDKWKAMILIYLLFTLVMIFEFIHGSPQYLLAELRKLILAVLFAHIIVSIDNSRGKIIDLGAKLGESSYSIYAYHAPLLVMALLLGIPWWLAPCLVLVIAMVVNVILEVPFTAIGKKLATKFI